MSRIRAIIDGGAGDDELWRGLMDLGIGAVVTPERYGGLGLGVLDIAAVMEMIGYCAAPVPMLGQVLGILALAHARRRRTVRAMAARSCHRATTGERRLRSERPGLDVAGSDLLIVYIDGKLALVELDAAVTVERLPGIDRTRTLSQVRPQRRCPATTSGRH